MPETSSHQDYMMSGDVFPNPNDFCNRLESWIDFEVNGHGQIWLDPGAGGYDPIYSQLNDNGR